MKRSLHLLSLGAVFLTATLAHPETEKTELSVFDAIQLALENNLQLQVDELSPEIAAEGVRQARGEFDPVFSVEGNWEDDQRRQNTLEFLSTGEISEDRMFRDRRTLLRTGIAQKLPPGTVVDLNTRLQRMRNTAIRERQSTLFDPEYEAFAGVDITQPLLRNFGPGTNLAGIRAARLELSIAEEEREIAVVNAISEVVNAYYDMVFGQENLRVKQEALEVAEELLRENQRRLDLGRMAPIDVAEARVRVSESEEEVIQAKDFLRERQLLLRRLIYDNPGASEGRELHAVAELPDEPQVPEDSHALYQAALELRPDYRLAETELRQTEIREDFSRNQALPRLDLQFSYGWSGLEGSTRSSYDRIANAREPTWSAGFVFTVPIGNQEAGARRASARKQRRQAEVELQKIEYEIGIDLQNAVARLETIG